MKLDLGAGPFKIPGFTPVDARLGTKVYPLAYPDNSADEIRASHVLEHFSHREQLVVLADWVRVLKPGGLLRIAVPNFDWITSQHEHPEKADQEWNLEGFLLGGHCDENDYHKSIWNERKLRAAFDSFGFLDVKPWVSEIKDCAALPVSLNLQGVKPATTSAPAQPAPAVSSQAAEAKLAVIMSVPRLGFMDNHRCVFEAFHGLEADLLTCSGAFWGAMLQKGMVQALAEKPDFLITIDYDTVFKKRDVLALVQLMLDHPEADAIAPLQSGRSRSTPLVVIRDPGTHEIISRVEKSVFDAPLVKVDTAHFGLTIFRPERFADFPKPWFTGLPSADGCSADDDIYFWRQWQRLRRSLYIAPRVVVGHMELMVGWPGAEDFGVIHQHVKDYIENGKPEGAWK